MKRLKGFVGLLCAAVLLASACASAETVFEGKVTSGETTTVFAPYGGMLKAIELREGQWIDEGDVVAEVETTKVFAAENGTVRGVLVEPGDSIGEEPVLYIAPINKYTIAASVEKAYSRPANKYVTIGEKVHIACSKDGTHKAVGIVTAVSGSNYTVETTGGELYMEETVYLYRSSSYNTSSRIGSGTVARTAEIAVTGTGSLLKMHVEADEEVERGQLLFETVEGAIDALTVVDGVTSTSGGVVASIAAKVGEKIAKGAPLLTIYPRENYQIEMPVAEDMLSEVDEGDQVSIFFDWNADDARRYTGTIQSISFMKSAASTSDDGTAGDGTPVGTGDGSQGDQGSADTEQDLTYTAYVSFDADENVRLGMTASIILP